MVKKKKDYEILPELVTSLNGVSIPDMSAKLLARTDHKAIYYRWDNVWEVFRIKIREEVELFGRKYPKMEVYPSNEEFGKRAWCFSNEKLAWLRYNNIPDIHYQQANDTNLISD